MVSARQSSFYTGPNGLENSGKPLREPSADTPAGPTVPVVGMLTAHGSRDSHAIVLADGSRNRSPRAGTPYGTVT